MNERTNQPTHRYQNIEIAAHLTVHQRTSKLFDINFDYLHIYGIWLCASWHNLFIFIVHPIKCIASDSTCKRENDRERMKERKRTRSKYNEQRYYVYNGSLASSFTIIIYYVPALLYVRMILFVCSVHIVPYIYIVNISSSLWRLFTSYY